MKIVFMGTPLFAAASLEAVIQAGFNVVVVVTAPDKPAGRGQKLTPSEVKQIAEKYSLPVLQPENLHDPQFISQLREYRPDVGVVVAFRVLPREVFTLPPLGTFNLHASLLPQYRGAAPIHHVLINGEKETGLTTFFLDENIDTGNIIFQEKIAVDENETFGELQTRMMNAGALLVIRTLEAIGNRNVSTVPQHFLVKPDEPLKKAPKIFKEDCRINWWKTSREVHNLIRGLSPDPGAFSFLNSPEGKQYQIKIYRTSCETTGTGTDPGSILTDGKSYLKVACTDGYVIINELQLSGKKKMAIRDFLNGFSLSPIWRFT